MTLNDFFDVSTNNKTTATVILETSTHRKALTLIELMELGEADITDICELALFSIYHPCNKFVPGVFIQSRFLEAEISTITITKDYTYIWIDFDESKIFHSDR